MPDENRLSGGPGPVLTPADAETRKRLMPINPPDGPGGGGWTPGALPNLLASVAIGVLMSVGAVIALPGLTVPVLAGATMLGVASGLSTFFGMKSAGTRKL